MTANVASRLGLVEAWQRTIPTPVGAASLADQKIFVHSESPHVYIEIVAGAAPAATATVPAATDDAEPSPGAEAKPVAGKPKSADTAKVLMRIAVGTPNARGVSIDQKEAERLASNEIRRMKRRGIQATMRTTEVQRVVLYSLADDGTLEARDAETGRPIWIAQVGTQGLHFGEIGVSEKYVTVVNGANLIQIDASNGTIIYQDRTGNAPQFGVINAGDFAMIATVGGGIEGYPLSDPTIDPFLEIVAGQAMAPPTTSPTSSRTAWSTDRGFVYVMELIGKPSTLFRLNTNGLVSGRIAAASGDRFFFGSDTGQAYALRATRSGDVMWVVPFGEPFYDQPLVIGEQVMMLSTYGRLFSMNIDNGDLSWDKPVTNVDQMLGGFGNQLFVRTMGGSLSVIDVKTGKTTGTFANVRPGHLLPNTQTDRLYLVGESGVVQCLRPIDSELPRFIVAPDRKPTEELAAETETKDPAEKSPFDPGSTDPFGTTADPFGAGGGADPFGAGGGADPFGGSGADPFGGGSAMDDPFGN
ncbi:outer membrane biogenesis protein BamB [Rubripirellula reticaptiva]|uniref:Outer membrane biogenesis protein BamB n=2 Tax=Rubripirellula reticaptiva TaxID=2528013 RepID=A0A5C6EHL6_9BACT|nr:outer membrane biogenesis protein BamB [Rubripirellula reticaptiva]